VTKRKRLRFSDWQDRLVSELETLAQQRPDDIRVTKQPTLDSGGTAVVRISLRTADIPREPGGLKLEDDEHFVLRIPSFGLVPPKVDVEHVRFLGFPHVLMGQQLCIYLVPSLEWHPSHGIAGLLNRLWDWLTDAAGGRFDASTAMYHAVGGVPHRAHGTPTIVVREAGPTRRLQTARLIARSQHRYDLTYSSAAEGLRAPVFTLATDLPFGAISSSASLLELMDDPYKDGPLRGRRPRVLPQSVAFVTVLATRALKNPPDSEQYFILAVPHPTGGPPHLLGGRLPTPSANTLRRIADPATIDANLEIEWCNMSDERQEVTTRRDDSRPVNGFRGKKVHVWGCGGLGSWIAEFVARAGAAHITVCDPGVITGGLLVRQNYVEDDIGRSKADALAARLEAIRDDLTVTVAEGALPDDPSDSVTSDLIIDATISNAITQCLDAFAALPERKALIAQVATDAKSGTLGILNLCAPNPQLSPSEIDQNAGRTITSNGELELYHGLWRESLDDHELIPTRGCSVPTFHGSAADLAAVAATLVSLLGNHLRLTASALSGTHLIALPHADSGPRHYFHPVETCETPDLHDID
jgi:hypothetical protein